MKQNKNTGRFQKKPYFELKTKLKKQLVETGGKYNVSQRGGITKSSTQRCKTGVIADVLGLMCDEIFKG